MNDGGIIEIDAPGRGRIIPSIQYLRAVAAILVVFHHARNPLPWLYNPLSGLNFGSKGVDVFFVISGFIMFTAARKEGVAEFARKRIMRIVPLYWAATLVWLGYQMFVWRATIDFVMVKDLLKSLLFIPYYNGQGHIWPFLTPGWTLNYEMFFYLLFGIGLATGRVVTFVTVSVIALCVSGILFHSIDPRWVTYSDPIMLEFIAGIFIAKLSHQYRLKSLAFCAPLGFLLLCLSDFIALMPIVAASLIVIGALSLDDARDRPALKLLGDASYAIYLFHIPVIATTELVVRAFVPDIGLLQLAMMLTIGVGGGVSAGIAAHLWIEKPLQRSTVRQWQKMMA